MKKTIVTIGIILGFIIALIVVKNIFLGSIVASATTMVTGAPTKISSFSISFLKQYVDIKGFRMYNPPGFPKEILVDIPEIRVDLDVHALLKKKLHLKKVILDLNEVTVIRNKEGKLNVDSLKVAQAGEKKGPAKAEKPTEQMPLQIDELYLNLGRVISKDYSKGEPPKIEAYELNLKNKTFKNITSAQQLVTLILSESLKGTAITGAKIFAANAALGVAFLPAGLAITLAGKDSSQAKYAVAPDKMYDEIVNLLKGMGDRTSLKSENKASGIIKALVDKSDVAIKIEKTPEGTSQVTVSARRMMLPKPEVASGLLEQISEKIKK
jgi:hypothetical protein